MGSSNTNEDESALVRACVSGGTEPWERFVARYSRLIAATARAVGEQCIGRHYDADDLAGTVYEKLLEDGCRRLRAWRGQSRFSTYLVQVTRNLCIDAVRRQKRGVVVDGFGEIPDWLRQSEEYSDVPWDEGVLKALTDALDALPPKQALLMRMRLEGKSLREIASLTRTPEGTVFVENSRALAALRGRLMPYLNSGEAPEAPRENP